MRKKGLSSVITTVLLILLGIVAIAIISVFLIGFLKRNSGNADDGSNSILISGQIEAQVVKYNPGKNVSLLVKRNPGLNNLTGVLFVLRDESGKSFSYNTSFLVEELGAKVIDIDFSNAGLSDLENIDIAPIFTSSSGKEVVSSVVQTISKSRISGGGGGGGGGGDDTGNGNNNPSSAVVFASAKNVNVGDNFVIGINVSDVSDLYSVEFDFRYDSSILQYVTMTEGSFMAQNGGSSYFFGPDSTIPGVLKHFAITKGGISVGVTGNGEIAQIQFVALKAGTSNIGIEKGLGGLFNPAFNEMLYKEVNGSVVVS